MKLPPSDPRYPRRLYHLDEPPTITVSGPLLPSRVVAIVGARSAITESLVLAHALGYHLARAGVTVVSGGAVGVDTAAHQGALRAEGTTWLVSPTGRGEVFPPRNEDLVEEILRSPTSRVIWPFPDGTPKDEETPRSRNGVLVALAECVVLIQAREGSGSSNAVRWAQDLERALYVVPGRPDDAAFAGSMRAGAEGAQPFWSVEWFFQQLRLPAPDMSDPRAAYQGKLPRTFRTRRRKQRRLPYWAAPRDEPDRSAWTPDEKAVFSILSMAPLQQDQIVAKAGLPTSSTVTALLTLSLRDVVVEGPDGFFRRRVSS